MAWIKEIDEHHATGELADLYGDMLDPEFGRVDQIMTIHSLHPAGLKAHDDLYRQVMAGTKTLRKVDREMISLIVSSLNACRY